MHLVNAWAEEQGLALGQLAVAQRIPRICVALELMALLTLRRKAATGEAVRYPRRLARQVKEREGKHTLALKGDQGGLHDGVRVFLAAADTLVALDTRTGKGRDRVEIPVVQVVDALPWLRELDDRLGLPAVRMIPVSQCKAPAMTKPAAAW